MKYIAGLISAAVIGTAILTPTVAQAAPPTYVALGDSYASGVGTRTYTSESGSCQRSTKSYPYLDAARIGANLTSVACSGARVADVTANQLGPLTSAVNFVTVQVGGNDAGFSSVITTCAQPAWLSDCDAAINTAQATINNTIPGRLNGLYATIRSRATIAKVIVVGYPRLFNGTDCNAGTFFSAAEMTRLNQTADLLNSKISAAAVPRATPSSTRPRPSSGTRSAAARSGSTVCPARSASRTTRTSPARRASPIWSAPSSTDRSTCAAPLFVV